MAVERLANIASKLVQAAAALDKAGFYEEAEDISTVLSRLAQFSPMRSVDDLLAAPGGFRLKQENLPNMAIGKQMGLNFNPLMSGWWGNGAESPLNMDRLQNPFTMEGKSAEQLKSEWEHWYGSPQVRTWFGQQPQRVEEYAKWLEQLASRAPDAQTAQAARDAARQAREVYRNQPTPPGVPVNPGYSY